jgi:hypothetical protein
VVLVLDNLGHSRSRQILIHRGSPIKLNRPCRGTSHCSESLFVLYCTFSILPSCIAAIDAQFAICEAVLLARVCHVCPMLTGQWVYAGSHHSKRARLLRRAERVCLFRPAQPSPGQLRELPACRNRCLVLKVCLWNSFLSNQGAKSPQTTRPRVSTPSECQPISYMRPNPLRRAPSHQQRITGSRVAYVGPGIVPIQ